MWWCAVESVMSHEHEEGTFQICARLVVKASRACALVMGVQKVERAWLMEERRAFLRDEAMMAVSMEVKVAGL